VRASNAHQTAFIPTYSSSRFPRHNQIPDHNAPLMGLGNGRRFNLNF